MRAFLTAFICLSVLVMAQNVIAIAPSSPLVGADSKSVEASADSQPVGADVRLTASSATSGRDIPDPGTMILLVAGLSGLTAVGARSEGRRTESPE